MDKKINVISDLEGNEIIIINDIRFKGKRRIDWENGTNAKAKANATQGIPMLIQCATNRRWQENYKSKHNVDAKFGWYRFTTRFALPVYNSNSGELERWNIFRIEMLIRHAADGNLYLYDMVNIKKKRAPRLSHSCTVTNPFLT